MIEGILRGILANVDPKIKSSLKKINEFMPLIKSFHDSISTDKEKGELGVGYMLRFEQVNVKDSDGNDTKEKETGIILYQCVLASKPEINNSKVFVSRTLNKWNVTEKINEVVNS